MSSDHHWGPRAMIFLEQKDYEQHRKTIIDCLSEKLPRQFRGYPTGFTQPDLNDHGTQLLDFSTEGPINHRVEVLTLEGFFLNYLGFNISQDIQPADWLTFPEQKLATVIAGRVFHDEIGLENIRRRFAYYPHDVWLYLLASGWAALSRRNT